MGKKLVEGHLENLLESLGCPLKLRRSGDGWKIGRLRRLAKPKSKFVCDTDLAMLVEPGEYVLPEPSQNQMRRSMLQWYQAPTRWDDADFKLGWLQVREWYAGINQQLPMRSAYDVLIDTDKSSSAGFPWNYMKLSKEEIAEDFGPQGLVESLCQLYSTKSGVCSIFSGFLKDELIKKKKLDEGRSRVILGAPLQHTLLVGTLSKSLNEELEKHRLGCPIRVGVNPWGEEWHELGLQVLRHPNHWYLDIKGFEFTRAPEEDEFIVDFRSAHLEHGPEQKDLLRRAYFDMTYAVAVDQNGDLYQLFGGTKSGFFNTCHDNSLICLRYLCSAWRRLCPHLRMVDHVILLIFGDDAVISVSDEAAKWFNPSTIRQYLANRGVEITGPRSWVPFEELDFLSCRWVKHPLSGRWVFCPVRKDKLLMSATVYSDTMSKVDRLIRLFQLQVLFVHDVDGWKKLDKLIQVFIDREKSTQGGNPLWEKALHQRPQYDLLLRQSSNFEGGLNLKGCLWASIDRWAPKIF